MLGDKLSLKIRPAQYVHHGKSDDIIVQYYVHGQVQETDQVFTRCDNIVFTQADLVKLVESFLASRSLFYLFETTSRHSTKMSSKSVKRFSWR